MYIVHNENLRRLDEAIEQIGRDLRYYICTKQESQVFTYTRLMSYLVICWTEVRLMKLANEAHAFTSSETSSIIGQRTLEDKWVKALEIGICKAYGLHDVGEIDTNLSIDEKSRYDKLVAFITTQLGESITIRNKISHGQWQHALNSRGTAVNPTVTLTLENENYSHIRLNQKTFRLLTQIIHDLCVSKRTYLRDFDKHVNQIYHYHDVYQKQGYEAFVESMVKKYLRGQAKYEASQTVVR